MIVEAMGLSEAAQAEMSGKRELDISKTALTSN